jgi:hypothetical protein
MRFFLIIMLIVIASHAQLVPGCTHTLHRARYSEDTADLERRLADIERRLEAVEGSLRERADTRMPEVPKGVDEGMMIDELERRNRRFVR